MDRIEEQLEALVEPILARHGLELVELALRGSSGRQVVRVDLDRPGTTGVGIDDCQAVSRELSESLDQLECLPGAYVLEVSSPGADRPIRSPDDFRRNTGRRVVIGTRGADGQEQLHRGVLLGLENGEIRLAGENGEPTCIPLEGVLHARQDLSL